MDQYGPCSGCTPIGNCQPVTLDLEPEMRYVRWLYSKDVGNVGLDDVLITNGVLSPSWDLYLPHHPHWKVMWANMIT
ncbi:MAG: hypothetical protein IPJ06_19550 [Saprospiraceae bacterium]|nr:hypothetical protein [Saprospiraceae bacterium]